MHEHLGITWEEYKEMDSEEVRELLTVMSFYFQITSAKNDKNVKTGVIEYDPTKMPSPESMKGLS